MRPIVFMPLSLALFMLASTACQAQTPPANAGATAAPTPAPQELQQRVEALKARTLAQLVFVEGGTFLMGDFGPVHYVDRLPYSPDRNDDVLRKVTLDSFSIAAYKTTYADFDIYTDATRQPRIAQNEMDKPERDLPGTPAGVNWTQAKAYCQWLGQQLNLPMDLPTEAQWEYAARNRGEMRVYATDNGLYEDGRNVASYEMYEAYLMEVSGGSPDFSSAGVVIPIGNMPPLPLGLYDMIDRAFEWVQDWYAPQYDPEDTQNPQGPATGTEKVLRSSSDVGWSLALTSMTFTRSSRLPTPPPEVYPLDNKPIAVNQNSETSVRCAVQQPTPVSRPTTR